MQQARAAAVVATRREWRGRTRCDDMMQGQHAHVGDATACDATHPSGRRWHPTEQSRQWRDVGDPRAPATTLTAAHVMAVGRSSSTPEQPATVASWAWPDVRVRGWRADDGTGAVVTASTR